MKPNKATPMSYPRLAKWLHWVSAIVIIWATLSGFYLSFSDSEAVKALIAHTNVSLTTLLIPVFLFRIAYRAVSQQPDHLLVSGHFPWLAHIAHLLLYALTLLVLVSGVIMMREPIAVFDWFVLPQPVKSAALNSDFKHIHSWMSRLLGCVVLIHIFAVIYHQRAGRQVLARML